jgi:hypothetical protein
MNNITPFPGPTDESLLLWAEPGTPARMAEQIAATPPRHYRMTDADAPSGAVVVYALGAASIALLIAIGWVAGILTSVAVLG